MTDSERAEAPAKSTSELRTAVVGGLEELAAMTPGRTGNVSVSDGDRVAITPSGIAYEAIEPAAVPVLSTEGDWIAGDLEPSSETPMHLGIYRTFDVGAIVHTHSPWTTTLAVLGEPLPPVHYMLAAAGGTVPVAPYVPFGTEALAEAVVSAMEEAGTTACILANHGLIAVGNDLEDAIETAIAVESTARVYLQARAVGDPAELVESDLQAAVREFETYGQREPESAGRNGSRS
ncbi:MAG: class II aldolase/adducin family protein [Halodesulfurarchaeum sp.]